MVCLTVVKSVNLKIMEKTAGVVAMENKENVTGVVKKDFAVKKESLEMDAMDTWEMMLIIINVQKT